MQKLFSDIDNYLSAEDRFAFRVRLDAAHPVYAGHIPGNPVLPGAARDAGTALRRSANASSSA